MHFSIPDTQELYEEISGTTYTGYNININGSYHCCLRFKQLHALHEQMRRCCNELNIQLPTFPPKRLLPLTNGQIETRRVALELYLQMLGQDTQLAKLEHFQKFLLAAQQETARAEALAEYGADFSRDISLDVVLMNGRELQVNCRVADNSTALLQKVCTHLKLPPLLLPYFCLFLMRKEENDTLVLVRRLMDFEAPCLSRRHAKPCQILLRTSYWNPAFDLKLLNDVTALNLLFIQTVGDVQREWIIATAELRKQLCALHAHDMKREYLEMARQLPLYGCLQFSATQVDYPDLQGEALISIGNKELSLRTSKGSKIYETKFRVTRMRCWRVTAIHNTLESTDTPTNLQLSFEYLMSKQALRWITITSAQAMLMSVCLQAMVDELLNCNGIIELCDEKAAAAAAADSPSSSSSHSYVSRNGRNLSQTQTLSTSASTPSFARSNSISTNSPSSPIAAAPVQFLSQQRRTKQNPKISSSHSYSAVFYRNAQESVHNEAFEGIGDDDL